MHVHVYCSDGEAKFWLEPEIAVVHNYRLLPKHIREIEEIIEGNYD